MSLGKNSISGVNEMNIPIIKRIICTDPKKLDN